MEQKKIEAFNDIYYEIEAYENNHEIGWAYFKNIRGMISICTKLGLLSSRDRLLLHGYLDRAQKARGAKAP